MWGWIFFRCRMSFHYLELKTFGIFTNMQNNWDSHKLPSDSLSLTEIMNISHLAEPHRIKITLAKFTFLSGVVIGLTWWHGTDIVWESFIFLNYLLIYVRYRICKQFNNPCFGEINNNQLIRYHRTFWLYELPRLRSTLLRKLVPYSGNCRWRTHKMWGFPLVV